MISDYTRYRIYEILPGLSVWVTFILIISLSFLKPLWMIYFIIIFDVYWVLKVVNYIFYLSIAWGRFQKVKKVDWHDKVLKEVDYKKYHHVIFLTLYNESWEVVESGIASIAKAVYDKKQFTIVIAGEERMESHYKKILKKTKEKFGDSFQEIRGTCHPQNLPEEIKGKGSNLHYSEKETKKYIDKKGWNYANVIATMFDIDTVCDDTYFAYLTNVYDNHPDPTKSSYQPIAMYNNNMWESPALLRIMAFGTTFWTFTSLARKDALVTFSSHSMSFKAIYEAGYHDKRIVSEDSRIFYQCLLMYNGNYEVTPLYVPVSMDTPRDNSWKKSIKNLYKQQRRWAWGVEHVPFLLWEFRKKGNKIVWWKKFKWIFLEWEGKWSWCLVALIITIVGRLPLWVAGEDVRQTALYFNAPHVLETLMMLSMAGLLITALFSFPLLPKRPQSEPRHAYIMMILQWLLVPISMIVVSAIPAIDATTHLMFGKYLGFNVSQKKRK